MSTEFTMTMSASVGKLAAAMAKAQLSMKPAEKDATNPHFKNRYATLVSCIEACRPLHENDIAVFQPPVAHGPDGVCVATLLVHSSGEWIRGELYLPASKKDPQGFGSALSYARRYCLQSTVNMGADDDDANQATKPPTNGKPEPAKANKPESDKLEKEFAAALPVAKTTDAVAKIAGDVAKAVQEGKLTAAARERLIPLYEAAVARLAPQAVAS